MFSALFEGGREKMTARLMASKFGRHEVHLERVGPSPISQHSAQESEWGKAYASSCAKWVFEGNTFEMGYVA